jgi:PhnB protein
MSAQPIPDTYRRVTPCLVVDGAAKALEFYADVFGATERMRFPGPDGTVVHAEIVIGDSVLIVEDVDAVVARAVERGATLKRAPQDQFYGDRDGYVIDLFGHGWTIATHVEDVAPDELADRLATLEGA